MQAYDVIILAGQSNAEGSGRGPAQQPYEPTQDVWQLDVKRTVFWENVPAVQVIYADEPIAFTVAQERQIGDVIYGDLALIFASDYMKAGLLEKGRKLLIVRAAVGATGFARDDEPSGLWGIGEPVYEKMIELIDHAMSLSPDNRLVAMLWHQGEHQVNERGHTRYEQQLRQVFLSVRERYGVPNLPIVAGDFVPFWKNKHFALAEEITDIQRRTLGELGHSAFVNTDGLLANDEKNGDGDDIHFCRQSLYDLGHRYFEAFQTIEK